MNNEPHFVDFMGSRVCAGDFIFHPQLSRRSAFIRMCFVVGIDENNLPSVREVVDKMGVVDLNMPVTVLKKPSRTVLIPDPRMYLDRRIINVLEESIR